LHFDRIPRDWEEIKIVFGSVKIRISGACVRVGAQNFLRWINVLYLPRVLCLFLYNKYELKLFRSNRRPSYSYNTLYLLPGVRNRCFEFRVVWNMEYRAFWFFACVINYLTLKFFFPPKSYYQNINVVRHKHLNFISLNTNNIAPYYIKQRPLAWIFDIFFHLSIITLKHGVILYEHNLFDINKSLGSSCLI